MTQVKVMFESDEGTEGLWATPVPGGFVLDNYPFFLKGVNFGDLVEATPVSPGIYQYVRTVAKSPHSLYRVLFENAHAARAQALLESLRGIGCSYESNPMDGEQLVAVHIPGEVDADAAWRIIEAGLDDGTWHVQEGEDRHACPDDDQC